MAYDTTFIALIKIKPEIESDQINEVTNIYDNDGYIYICLHLRHAFELDFECLLEWDEMR